VPARSCGFTEGHEITTRVKEKRETLPTAIECVSKERRSHQPGDGCKGRLLFRRCQLYHHYLGDPLDVLMLYPDGSGAVATVGSDLGAGECPQLFIPGGTFHTSRLAPGSNHALLASTEWSGVEPSDVEHGDIDALIKAYPDYREKIRALTGQE
jgi:hypothetical protein